MAPYDHEALLLQLYNHAVLPRDVPGREDNDLYQAGTELARRFTDAVKQLAPHAPLDDLACLDAIRLALSTCTSLNVDGKIDKNMLVKELRQLDGKQALILHVTEQNAALLIYLHLSDDGTKSVILEAFETSATCEQVLAAEDALEWDFPGQAVAIPYETFSSDDFQCSLSTFLEQASLEAIKKFAAVTYKACAPLPEIRDTPDPTLVTGALMTLLEVNGVAHDTPLLRKRVRDTVSFHKAHKPWRRSPFYLVLRVSIQRHLYTLFGPELGRLYYKIIMCIFLSRFLDEAVNLVSDAASNILCQKLGRRLAKLELDHDRGSQKSKTLHRHVFASLRPIMEKSLYSAAQTIKSHWEAHKRNTSRRIRPIPQFATPSDVTLRLTRSGPALQRAMYYQPNTAQSEKRSPEELLGHYESNITSRSFVAVMNRHLSLCEYEEEVSTISKKSDERSDSARCIYFARSIETYISTVQDAYVDYSELKSRQILKLMELWQAMDEHAVICYPILGKYHPGFDAAMLDVLELSTFEEMKRLRTVQSYVAKRCQAWCGHGSRTIFDSPAEDSYAARHYDHSGDALKLQELRIEIEEDVAALLACKEEEWEKKSQDHESKIREMAGLSCPYETVFDENGYAKQVHKKGCRKHRLKWEAKQISIDIHEHPLPSVEADLKAVIFELMCPKAFAAYRDATWLILFTFAFPITTSSVTEVPLLRAYSGLCGHANNTKSKVTLGSSTKSHLDSHYATSGFPTPFRDVSRPFGLKLDYYDNAGKTWILRKGHPSLSHLFPLKLPPNSPYHAFEHLGNDWPTSNRILATQTKCPSELNVHEYMAWQGLLLGTYIRWPSLLREMGSTNLNFSTDATWAMVSRLCLQVGPATSDDLLRDVHAVFYDKTFCSKLLEQVDYRLEAIRRNWREPIQLDILITILLKVSALSSNFYIRGTATHLLEKARNISQGWYANLEFADPANGTGPSVFAIWAAVLCKRTFYPSFDTISSFRPHTLKDFIIASFALQDCLVGDFHTLPYSLRNAVLRDLTLAHNFRHRLRDAIITNSWALLEALGAVWPVPAECSASSVNIYPVPGSWWVVVTILTREAMQHHVHYSIIHGTLIINGQRLGMLPLEYRQCPILQELFGLQTPKTYPSTLPGMSLVISRQMPFDHWVHLGFRDQHLVVRATHNGNILELIERSLFGNERQYDLPKALGKDCYHWLDLTTGILEIRQQDPWKSKRGNWRLNFRTSQATRNNGSMLVDPNSAVATKVAQNFQYFEYSYNITVYQPLSSNLRVELKNLELDFVVRLGLLFCPQLGAAIAESQHQDVGTWYGLKSKLVVRSLKDPTQRSILLPFGVPTCKREGSHVSVVISNDGNFLKFGVNNVLGRIDCPTDPLMLYHKAFYHASTAYFLPDPLTGRTGVEEALQYLQSGAYRPWSPLAVNACNVLLSMARFSPQRVYYPSSLKAMESVHWQSTMTVYMQDDRYRRAINEILERNTELSKFSTIDVKADSPSSVKGEVHLENRALSLGRANPTKKHCIYKSRDRRLNCQDRTNVAAIASLLSQWPSQMVATNQLASLLEQMPIIGGYVRTFDKVQITDILEVDLGVDWGALVQTASSWTENEKFQATFLFFLLAFSSDTNMELLRTIASFALIPDLKLLLIPQAAAYTHFQSNEVFEVDAIMRIVGEAKQPYASEAGTPTGQLMLRRLDHDNQASRACKIFAESIYAQWPAKELDLSQLAPVEHTLLDRDEALVPLLSEWSRLVDNFLFSKHIEEVQLVLFRHSRVAQTTIIPPTSSNMLRPRVYPSRMRGGDLPTLRDILEKDLSMLANHVVNQTHGAPMPILTTLPNGCSSATRNIYITPKSRPGGIRGQYDNRRHVVNTHTRELSRLIAPYKISSSMVHMRYGAELEHSIQALSAQLGKPEALQEIYNPTEHDKDIFDAKQSLDMMLKQISIALQGGDTRARWLNLVGLWPKMTPLTLLTELRTTSGVNFGLGAKEALVGIGLAITSYQRLLRIKNAATEGRRQQMLDEYHNPGHQNWSPANHVNWLLLEIESDILLRSEQVNVALATISPESAQNSVLQLLMGKGKTSCILPMVALELASKHLFRIIVPRPLLLQSAQIMQAKLGGLLNREVMHIPFSRKTRTEGDVMQAYNRLHNHVHKRSGIILALPEHILSFKLSGLQKLCDGKIEEAAVMIQTQARFDRYARDVLDECDVSLAIRTQLIYPSGSQQTVDGHPSRWQTVQAILDLVLTYLDDLIQRFPSSIEVVRRLGFPLVYFLRKDAEEYLVDQLASKICTGQTAILPVGDFPRSVQKELRDFISVPTVGAETTGRVLTLFQEKRHTTDVVLHLRGLFVHRILLSTLKKRWNVQYGLNPTRVPIAVPYQAKGVPSPTAEWGHPDVAIILTCLSFYYEGLTLAQLKRAFEQLAKSDEPSIEFSLWVADGVPEVFTNYNAINAEDSQQLRELHHHIKYKVCLIDFYLNSFVFPQHAKQFSKKLSASGSDLVLFEPTRDLPRTTGFSGTNDSRHQLPMTIKQNDLPQLAHTNAEVLFYLLEERNRRYVRMVDVYNKRLSEEGLLEKLLQPYGYRPNYPDRVQILIDAGAQILEHDNFSLAKAWLKEDHKAAAAVYFSEDHRAMVIYGKGTVTPLVASPFAENLEGCLVYIDESHCRGTDLKLPPHARAAVTLGPHLTKDALVQAAMRLRLLGKTQSVTFFSPPEVHQSILDLRASAKARTDVPLCSVDVIRWLLEQSCNAIEQLEPLYFNQGITYLRQIQAKIDFPDFLNQKESRDAYLSNLRTEELLTLRQLYEPKYNHRGTAIRPSEFAPALQPYVKEMLQRRRCFQDRGFAVQSAALEEVEQEREMEYEVECVREVQQPIHFKALKIVKLHRDIEDFGSTGKMAGGSDAWQPMFCALQKTALGMRHGAITAVKTAAGLYVSSQFTRTASVKEPNDNFLRPCHWLLWSCIRKTGLLVSPEEADSLIPLLGHANLDQPACHLIVYAPPTTRRMLQFNNLDYYAIPPLPSGFKAPAWLKVELGMFAGRLYFEWDEHNEMMAYLGIRVATNDGNDFVQSDPREAFATEPLALLHEWLAVRRKGQDFEHTPMGFVTTDIPLFAEHPFFSASEKEGDVDAKLELATKRVTSAGEDDDESDDGEDHAKEHLFHHDENDDDHEVFHDVEEEFTEGGNTFFDGGEYVHTEDQSKEDK